MTPLSPLAPRRPSLIVPNVWDRMPLSKQRLLVFGPLDPGTDAAREAAVTCAAELCQQGVPEELAQDVIRRMPFTPGSTAPHRVRKQLENSVHFAYNPPNGLPFLSGCCQDPRPRSGNPTPSRLRRPIEGYCDKACALTCPILRAIRYPSLALEETPFGHINRSNLWMRGAGFGQVGRIAFQLLALLAFGKPETDVLASSRYLCIKSGGIFTADAFRKVLRKFHGHGLVTLLDKRTGLRRVHAPGPKAIAALEAQLGVTGQRESNIAQARRESDEYRDWLAEDFARHGDEGAALAAWDPAPAEARDEPEDRGRAVPPFLQNWGGTLSKKRR